MSFYGIIRPYINSPLFNDSHILTLNDLKQILLENRVYNYADTGLSL